MAAVWSRASFPRIEACADWIRTPGNFQPLSSAYGSRAATPVEILEATLVLPILFFVIFAMIWLGLAFNISSTLHRAARQALRGGFSLSGSSRDLWRSNVPAPTGNVRGLPGDWAPG